MSLTTMDVPFCSSTRVSGSGVYTSATLECNWNEDRVRLDAGEYVYMPLMEGAQVRPEETDISIAPPTRDRGKASDGRLVMPHRSMRSRATQDSSRFVTDDGYRVTLSTHLNDYTPIGERVGAVQVDDLSKTRTGVSMREKNSQLEPNRVQDGEAKMAKKMLNAATIAHLAVPRPSEGTGKPGYGGTLPLHNAADFAHQFDSTHRLSYQDPKYTQVVEKKWVLKRQY